MKFKILREKTVFSAWVFSFSSETILKETINVLKKESTMDKSITDTFGGYEFASDLTGIKTSTLYVLVHKRRIPHLKINRRFIRFSKGDLLKWLEQHKVEVKTLRVAK